MSSENLDWRDWSSGWRYKGDTDDPQYLKDRSKFFKENGNGWWWYEGVYTRSESKTKLKKRRDKNNGRTSK
jgi:hypothetical protein